LAAFCWPVTQQHIIGMPAQVIIMGIPAFIMVIICSQQAMNIVCIEASMQVISQVMPVPVMVQVILAIMHGPIIWAMPIGIMPADVQHIDMPPQDAITGMPMATIADICWQQARSVSFMPASIGIISQVMPVGVMVQVIFAIMHDIGIIPPIGIMPGIGMVPICGIIAPIPGIIIGIIAMAGIVGVMVIISCWFADRSAALSIEK
jgi:hypothetical protein